MVTQQNCVSPGDVALSIIDSITGWQQPICFAVKIMENQYQNPGEPYEKILAGAG